MMMRSIRVTLSREGKREKGASQEKEAKKKDDGLRCSNFRVSKATKKKASLSKEKK